MNIWIVTGCPSCGRQTDPRNQSEVTKLLLDWPNGLSTALVPLTPIIQ